jgi:hypothetical protein
MVLARRLQVKRGGRREKRPRLQEIQWWFGSVDILNDVVDPNFCQDASEGRDGELYG